MAGWTSPGRSSRPSPAAASTRSTRRPRTSTPPTSPARCRTCAASAATAKAFYSVAQHSAIVCDLLEERGATPDELMAALLHDAAEAYLGDLPHPLKHRSELGARFRVAEKRLEAVIERALRAAGGGGADQAARQGAAGHRAADLQRGHLALARARRRRGARARDRALGRPPARCGSSRAATSASTRSGAVDPPASEPVRNQSTEAGSPARAKTSLGAALVERLLGQRLNASRSGRSVVRTMNAVTSLMRSPSQGQHVERERQVGARASSQA